MKMVAGALFLCFVGGGLRMIEVNVFMVTK